MKEISTEIVFSPPNILFINNIKADLISSSANSTADQCAPFISNMGLRLLLPKVGILLRNDDFVISTFTFGNHENHLAATERFKNRVEKDYISHMFNRFEEAMCLQSEKTVCDELLHQANLFREKSNILSKIGICPPVGNIVKFVNIKLLNNWWPSISYHSETADGKVEIRHTIQISKKYIAKFPYVYALEVDNANSLPEGKWTIEKNNGIKQRANHPAVKNYDHMEPWSTNIINGYFVDWEIWSWDLERNFGI